MLTAVVLAAGASTRMGRHKLVLPLGGEPIVRRTVRQVVDAGFDRVLVVVGNQHEQTISALEGLPFTPVLNPDFTTGMGSSFRTAVEHLGASRAALFALADQVMVPSTEYRRMRDTYLERGSGIVCARYGNVTAPPHVFDREFFPELSVLEHGARSVLERHRDRTVVMQLDPSLLLDIDTPEDYERALAVFESRRSSEG
jgi:molybdenum cofactor cytidylyltransferase